MVLSFVLFVKENGPATVTQESTISILFAIKYHRHINCCDMGFRNPIDRTNKMQPCSRIYYSIVS